MHTFLKTLGMSVLTVLLASPLSAQAGKTKGKNRSFSVSVDGDDVVVMKDGKLLDPSKIKMKGNQLVVLDDDGETVFVTVPAGSGHYRELLSSVRADSLMIGVWIEPVDEALAAQLGLEPERGIVISRVEEDGPAAKGGLEKYDVITEVSGSRVTDLDAVGDALAKLEEGDTLKLEVLRAGKRVDVDVVPEKRAGGYAAPFFGDAERELYRELKNWEKASPNVLFFPRNEGEVAVITEQAREAYQRAMEAHSDAEGELQDRLQEMEDRLREMEERLEDQ